MLSPTNGLLEGKKTSEDLNKGKKLNREEEVELILK